MNNKIEIKLPIELFDARSLKIYDTLNRVAFPFRTDLIEYVGKPYDSSFDIMKVIDSHDASKLMSLLKKSYYSSPKIELSDVLDLYGILIPEHLLEKYLMVKLAV